MPDVQLNGIEFAIKSDTTSAVVSIDRLRQALSKLQKIHINDLGLKSASKEIRRFANSIGSIQTQKLDALSKSLRGLASFGNAFSKIGENPEKLATGLSTMTEHLREISTIDFTNLKTAAESINQITARANKNGRQAADSARETGKGIKLVANEAKKASSPLSNFASSLKRIAFYRIIRSIIKAITEALSEGLKNAYEFSKLTGGALSQALDTIATKSLTMKNQLGAAFGGLLTAITPAILTAINIITKLAAAITRLIAILGGSSQWMRAKDVWTEWGEAAAGAGGAAKKALEYLAPFDELNVLPDPKSGGGGGANDPAYGDMFEWVSIEEGAGLADALKNAFDGVSEFFGSKDWAALADQAWEKLKEGFSDTGKATEVIRSMFRALGTLIGAGSAFIGEFCRNIVESIMEKFRANLIDYNGDGKISVGEFLKAVFRTAKDIAKEIRDWVKANIVDPFMDGYADGIGLADKSEIYSAVTNFGIDLLNKFNQKVINPIIETWNNFVDDMPDWLRKMIENMTGGDLKIPLIGEISQIDTDSLDAKLKIIQGMVAGISSVKDNIPKSQKYVNVVANYTSGNLDKTYMPPGGKGRTISVVASYTSGVVDQNKMPVGGKSRIIFVTAHYDKAESKLTKAQTTIDSTANLNKRYDNLTEQQRTLTSYADFKYRYDHLSEKQRTLISYADFKYRYDHLTDDRRTFTSTADFNKSANSLTSEKTTFGSTARMDYLTDNLSAYQKTFSSTAKINSYTIADNMRDWSGNLNVDAKVNIVGQANTPTVAVNASYNTPMVRAMGGAFYGGNWHDIPQYATGGRPHGSLFIAGEAGSELVGHIGGRTEVLNQSQIAASIAAGVHRTLGAVGVTASGGYNLSDGANDDALYRAFKRALDETDFGGDVELDGETIYRAMVRRNRANTRLTGVNAMA